jgi:hypothetical protein
MAGRARHAGCGGRERRRFQRQDRREPARGAAAAAAEPAAGDDQGRRAAGAACAGLALRARDVAALTELFTRYGFHAALRELSGAARARRHGEAGKPALNLRAAVAAPAEAPDPALARKGDYECVLTHAQLDAWLARLRSAPLLAFDTETDSLDPMQARWSA